MLILWLLYSVFVAAVLGLIAHLGERVLRWRGDRTRWFWLAVTVLSVVTPVLLNLLPQFPVAVSSSGEVLRVVPVDPYQGLVPHASKLNTALLIAWIIGSCLLIARIVYAGVVLQRRRRRWISAELNGVPVLVSDHLGPAVIGWGRFTTVIPRWALSFDERARAIMIAHETEHAQSGDPYLRCVGLLALILMPWNPVLWWTTRRLRLAVELDCDQRLLKRGIDPREYASLLLAVGERISATPFAWATALGHSKPSLEKRIIEMVSPIRPRHPKLAVFAINAACVTIGIVACTAPVPDSLVPPPTVEVASSQATNPAWSPDGRFKMVADTLFFVCQDSPEARADTACAHGPRVYLNYRGRASDTFVDRDDLEIPSVRGSLELSPDTARVRPVKWGHEKPSTGRSDSVVVVRGGRLQVYLKTEAPRGYFIADTIEMKFGGVRPDTVRLRGVVRDGVVHEDSLPGN